MSLTKRQPGFDSIMEEHFHHAVIDELQDEFTSDYGSMSKPFEIEVEHEGRSYLLMGEGVAEVASHDPGDWFQPPDTEYKYESVLNSIEEIVP